jgi:hypothetical protein
MNVWGDSFWLIWPQRDARKSSNELSTSYTFPVFLPSQTPVVIGLSAMLHVRGNKGT